MKVKNYLHVSTLLITILFFLTFFFIPSSYAQQPEKLANITIFEGDVFVKSRVAEPKGEWAKLKKAPHILYNGDEVKTEKGTAEIEFLDGSIVKMAEKTSIAIDESLKKRKSLGIWLDIYKGRTIKVFFGKLWAEIKPSKEKKTEFESPTVVAGVRATTLSFSFDPATGNTTITAPAGSILDVSDIGGVTHITFVDGEIAIAVNPETGEITFTVISGSHTIESSDGTKVQVNAGDSVGITYDPVTNTSTINVTSGTVTVTDPQGQSQDLTAGQTTTTGGPPPPPGGPPPGPPPIGTGETPPRLQTEDVIIPPPASPSNGNRKDSN